MYCDAARPGLSTFPVLMEAFLSLPKTVPSERVIEISEGFRISVPSYVTEYVTFEPEVTSTFSLPSGDVSVDVFSAIAERGIVSAKMDAVKNNVAFMIL